MAPSRNSTRQRLIQTALELFVIQGVTDTTTKQIAEQASVNEVTLFRHFGSKYGLLFAVIEESAVFAQLGHALVQRMPKTDRLDEALHAYATAYLRVIDQVPDMVRSMVGEAGQYPHENRAALGRGLAQANQTVADYFNTVAQKGKLAIRFSPHTFSSLLNSLLLGYAMIELTSDSHNFWQSQDEFIDHLIPLFQSGAIADYALEAHSPDWDEQDAVSHRVDDLPASLVHEILQRAKKKGLSEYAMLYVIFGAGLSAEDMAQLERSHHISDRDQHILHVPQGKGRQVPINQWIMGKRYGSYRKNPLTQWLKSRHDQQRSLFINPETDQPTTVEEIEHFWQDLTQDLVTLSGEPPTLAQAQHTWCVEMIMRGMSPSSMTMLTGWTTHQLAPYMQRAAEKSALEQAIRLDRKTDSPA
ncbi:MAG: TetR/AcrR family transcriptional regulator [Elainellaceae cyanobacterium]